MKTWVKTCSIVVCAAMVSQVFAVSAFAGEQVAPVLPPLLGDVDAVPLTDAEAEMIRGEVDPVTIAVVVGIIVKKYVIGKVSVAVVSKAVVALGKAAPSIAKAAQALKLAKTQAQIRTAVRGIASAMQNALKSTEFKLIHDALDGFGAGLEVGRELNARGY